MLFLIKGILLGFSIAAPVGPIGVLCIRRTLVSGLGTGFVSGLGAATADAIYGVVAALGLSVVSQFLLRHQSWLHIAGGLFLLYLGYQTYKSPPAMEAAAARGEGLFGAYASTLFLTLTNPMTILSFVAIFAGVGLGSTGTDYWSSSALVLGVFIGSMLWWLLLSAVVNKIRNKFDQTHLRWINQFSGLIIMAFGIYSLITL